MKKFTVNMRGQVNGVDTTFSIQVDLTKEQLQKYIIEEAILEAEHKGFDNLTIQNLEEVDDHIQMDLFPNKEPLDENSSEDSDDNYISYTSIASSKQGEEESSEDLDLHMDSDEDTENTEDEEESNDYTPYTSPASNRTTIDGSTNPSTTYTAYTETPCDTELSESSGIVNPQIYRPYCTIGNVTAPKSYHIKLGNSYAPYRSFRINITTTEDIT